MNKKEKTMRCTTAKKWVSQYLDGDLDSKRRAQLQKHISACSDCRKLLQDFQEIVGHAQDISGPSSRTVTWGKIQARLEANPNLQQVPAFSRGKPRLFFRWGYVWAAAAALLVVVGAVTLGPRFAGRAPMASQLERMQYTLDKLDEAELHYKKAIKALAEAVEAQGRQIDPQLAGVFKANLEIVNSSILACKQAVLSDPQNLEPRQFLLAAYKQKTDLLNMLMHLPDESSPQGSLENTL